MSYSSVLAGFIEQSGKSLNEISRNCAVYGVKITPSYISKLKNGKNRPPSDKVNKAIARVVGCDPEDLILAAYRQKIPSNILSKLAGS